MNPASTSGGSRRWQRATTRIDRDAVEWNVSPVWARVCLLAPIAVALAIGSLAPVSAARPLYRALVWEDGIVEWIQVLLVTGIIVLGFVIRRRLADTGHPWFSRLYLVSAIAAVFVLGEEVSWGQRIFGWTTPGPLEQANLQGETNLHNIEGVLSTLNLVMLGIAATAAAVPIAWRVWAGARTRTFAEALLVPPLFAVPAFLAPVLYRFGRMLWLPEAPATISRYQEVTEMCFYFGFFVFASVVAARVRRHAVVHGAGGHAKSSAAHFPTHPPAATSRPYAPEADADWLGTVRGRGRASA
jgi:hypothetical protein